MGSEPRNCADPLIPCSHCGNPVYAEVDDYRVLTWKHVGTHAFWCAPLQQGEQE